MSSSSDNTGAGSVTKQALAKIRDLKQQLLEAESGQNGPIAIVSVACRFPRNSDTPEKFWDSLLAGNDEVGEVPPNRWDLESYFDADPEAPGKLYARKGAFLDRIDGMDADFFGISPREATWIDPQQRLFLETGWEAMERAGWASNRLDLSTGVFLGWMHNDYQNEASEILSDLNPYIATGSAGSFLSGRLSYYLGVQGPSLAIDTACSSSLVAIHLACQSLRRRECDRALAGGVNVMVSPKTTIMTCKLHALSPDGNSRAFDASADGYLRGEGCGIVSLKRLSDAERDGDPILAVIRGSAITHNGASSGLTAPNPDSQRKVIQAALDSAGIDPADVDYLEAHGTGTELGDPLEMQAAAAVLGNDRDPRYPLLVGSVKTNIGHLEAAAGTAGLIKTVLALQKGQIPPHLNFEVPNPHIPWDDLPVRIVTEPTEWPRERRIAGVSGFGMSGTNAHLVVEQAPDSSVPIEADEDDPSQAGAYLLPLSGKSDNVLVDLAGRYRDWFLENPSSDIARVCYTAGAARRHFEKRVGLVVESPDQAVSLLEKFISGMSDTGLHRGESRAAPMVAWQFTGQGSQYPGMGKKLYDTQPVFRKSLDRCAEILHRYRDRDLLEVIFEDDSLVNDTTWTQPALFAIEIALADLLMSWGLVPDAVLGHSVGQFPAACIAGIMSVEDGMRLIHERARLIGQLPQGGSMMAVFADEKTIREIINPYGSLSIAAYNASHIVISGPEEDINAVEKVLGEKNARCKVLNTSHAFHSSLLDPVLDEFAAIADTIEFSPARIPLICNVTGEVMDAGATLDGDYWRRHLREAVRFEQSIRTAADMGCNAIVELGPHPVLTGMASAAWTRSQGGLVASLEREADDEHSVLSMAAKLYAAGVMPDFEDFLRPRDTRILDLPTYPFQRERFWGPEIPTPKRSEASFRHPILGDERPLAGVSGETRFEGVLTMSNPRWLDDHKVFGDVVFPGAAYVEMAVGAIGSTSGWLENIAFEHPLQIREKTTVQTVARDQGEKTSVEVFSRTDSAENWARNFSTIGKAGGELPEAEPLGEVQARCSEVVEPATLYSMFDELGIQYGEEFQTIRSIGCDGEEVLARLDLPGDHPAYIISPMLLDGAFHSMAVRLLKESESTLYLPVGMERFAWGDYVSGEIWCHSRWHGGEGDIRTADITIYDESGQAIAFVEKLKLRAVSRSALRQMVGSGSERLLYRLDWKKAESGIARKEAANWLIVGDNTEGLEEMSAALEAAGQDCFRLLLGKEGQELSIDGRTAVMDASGREQWNELLPTCFADSEGENRVDGVVWLCGNSPETVWAHCSGLLALIHTLVERESDSLGRGFHLITRNAVAVTEGDEVNAHAGLYWGLGRVINNENPHLRSRLLDFVAAESPEFVASSVMTASRESQSVLRDGQAYVPRFASFKPVKEGEGLVVRGDSTYLITGGLGNLGRRAAMWLAERGASDVVLVSRREPDESTRGIIEQINNTGCRVFVAQADISDRESVENLISEIGEELPPLKGVIHSAGVVDDALFADQSWSRFERVFAPKVSGAWYLHELTEGLDLDFFVLYSSAASVIGSPGQANYAAANAFLDSLALHRRAMGLPALSVNFGAWNEGMAAVDKVAKTLAAQGMTPLTAEEAHESIDQLINSGVTQATVMDVDWSKLRNRFPFEAPAVFEDMWPAAGKGKAVAAILPEKLRKAGGAAAAKEVLMKHLQEELQAVLSLPKPPEPDLPLSELGLDSLMAVEFSTRLQQQAGSLYPIQPTLAFDFPSVAAMTDYLFDLLGGGTGDKAAVIEVKETAKERPVIPAEEGIAVIGIGCRFPGAESPEEYWQLLRDGVDATIEIPSDRWNQEEYYDSTPTVGKMYTNRGGFLPDIGDFDAEFFGISETEAAWTDPQHRMLLEVSWEAMENASLTPERMRQSEVGVFVGILSTDYSQMYMKSDPGVIHDFEGMGMSHSAAVGRLSNHFGFDGPSMAVDTASSSSLVAVSQAAKSLLDGECNIALAGGVNAILSPTNSLLLCKAGMLSPDGRCKSFSAEADGFARGEGCGIVVLKRLSDARRDGDHVLAVIRGSGISHNGQRSSNGAPSTQSQHRMIRQALAKAGIAPSDVSYLEAHGTGTELGDSIELRAATDVLGEGRDESHPLLVGSAKANIGHLEAAAGISGLIKVVLSMSHGAIPRQIHFEHPSPHIPWDSINAKVVTEEMSWPEGRREIAGVSALGINGTNAHVILEAPGETESGISADKVERSHHLLTLSAKSPEALRELADRYRHWLDGKTDISVAELCHSAGVGRHHFKHRLSLVVSNAGDVVDIFQSRNGTFPKGVYEGEANSSARVAWYFPPSSDMAKGTGVELYDTQPVFREAVELCSDALGEGVNIRGLLAGETEAAGPVLAFALQRGLAALWSSWGITPEVIAGDGVGEIAAACAGGMISWDEGLSLVINGAEAKPSGLSWKEANIPVVCNATGTAYPLHFAPSEDFWQNLNPAGDGDLAGLLVLQGSACDAVLELGSSQGYSDGITVPVFSSLRQGIGENENILHLLAAFYVAGITPDFAALDAPFVRRVVPLPTYAFQRKRYWAHETVPAEAEQLLR